MKSRKEKKGEKQRKDTKVLLYETSENEEKFPDRT
jgi:hypothetical protein